MWRNSGTVSAHVNIVIYVLLMIMLKLSQGGYSYNSYLPLRYFKHGFIPNYCCKVTLLQRKLCQKSTKIRIFSQLFWKNIGVTYTISGYENRYNILCSTPELTDFHNMTDFHDNFHIGPQGLTMKQMLLT